MEALRKSKSSSTLGNSDGVEISEITTDFTKDSFGGFLTSEKMDTLQIITEPDDHSRKNSTGSLVIEECEMTDTGIQKPETMNLESADSSDNISQYLDKEERVPDKPQDMEETTDVGENDENKRDEERNQDKASEETKRKRKLSAESSYSKISLTKSAMMKKLRDAKNKIKVPKITFPTSKLKRTVPKKSKNSPPEVKKDIKKSLSQPKIVKPIYIYIPLKPPPGQTDEFSYLADEKSNEKPPPQAKKSFKNILLNIKQLQETNVDNEQNNEIKLQPKTDKEGIENSTILNKMAECEEVEMEDKESDAKVEKESTKSITESETDTPKESKKHNKESINNITESEADTPTESKKDNKESTKNIAESEGGTLTESNKDNKDSTKNITESETDTLKESNVCEEPIKITADLDTAIKKSESRENEKKKVFQVNKIILPTEDLGLILKLDKDESLNLPGSQDTEDSNAEDEVNTTPKVENEEANDIFGRLFKARATSSREQEPEVPAETKVRSKSAEPERKRKLSLESSYSRKSLSKLGILKKLKEASDKIKHSLSRSNSKKKPTVEEPTKKEVKIKQTSRPVKKIEPVYIHIPLKPPEGETDEFSYLEYGEKPLQNEVERNRISSSPESPGRSEGVQFIMVTAPSDDEILDDYHGSDVPETPSSENKIFFGHKLDELKELAKDIVDEITPPPATNKLESVSEETISDKVNIEKINNTNEVDDPNPTKPTDTSQREKITVDVEDGLSEIKQETQNTVADLIVESKESEVAVQPVELKSNLKGENSPVMKKKVSFRRRSKTPKDGTYENIQAAELPADVEKCDVDLKKLESAVDPSQSMSVDEEKTYLDEKIINSTSLEEDYNKWSKISDHEYEPVNPPPDNEPFPATPTVHITDTDLASDTIEPISGISLTTASINHEITKDGAIHKTEPSISPQVQTNINSSTSQSDHEGQNQEASISDKKEGPSKFQLAFKQKTDQFKSKLRNIKKPHITMPEKSKLQKFKIERPKFNFPKIPDTTRINLPSFSLPRRKSAKRSQKERQQSTESNDGDSKKQIFDFSTYPRIFKKKPKNTQEQNQDGTTDFVTVPRFLKKSKPAKVDNRERDIVRIPLHSEESVDIGYSEEPTDPCAEPENKYEDDREDSVERRMASHIRYGEDIDIDDEYERENHEINKDNYLDRWHHGNFNPESNQDYLQNYKNSEYKVTDLDSPEDPPVSSYNFNTNNNKDNYSSGSSLGVHRVGGVLEEINSDEFFLRQKGISQDNIEVGMYLSSEIREAFRTPDNALSKIQDIYHQDYELRGSNQSLPETQNKRKPIKKPKRKKTPHASQEKIPYDEESGDEDLDTLPPSRPKRRSKRVKKPRNFDDVIPYQETISVDTNNPDDRLMFHRESLGILGDDEREVETNIMYENEQMEGKDQPEIKITDPYRNFEFINMRKYRYSQDDNEDLQEKPAAPPRKQKSLKSLNLSENDSILEDLIINKENSEPEIKKNRTDLRYNDFLSKEPPKRPTRIRSRTNSQSRGTSQQDDESLSYRTESLTSENQIPCVEEPCIKDIRDYMGYAIIDKQKARDPPLPPPRPPNRHKRSIRSINSSTEDPKFFTVPRSKDESKPVRPLRNYSTLGQTRKNSEPATYENKENIDIIQYIEIDDEPNRDLQSGDVIKKMKDRPLPAPPRPPRKSRPLRDITSKENIMSEPETGVNKLDELEMSTQTEPLSDNDFLCEEEIREAPDTISPPSRMKKPNENVTVERRLITPTYYTHEETVTHGTLLVQPLNNSKIISDSELTHSKEKIIPINVESDGDETSTIPDEFKNLKDPSHADDKIIQETTEPGEEESINALKAQKLKISDLDVDTLTVNKLLAGKIVVSEIDSSTIQANEISSKSGTLKIGEIELPPGVIEQIIKSITSKEDQSEKGEETVKYQEDSALEDEQCQEQKKTPITAPMDTETSQEEVQNLDLADTNYLMKTENVNEVMLVDSDELPQHQTDSFEYNADELQSEPPQPPPRSSGPENVVKQLEDVPSTENYNEEFPQRPPRQSEKLKCDSNTSNNEEIMHEPDVDDEPPPRPPQPQLDYLPSQPPASFYALRAQQFLDTLDDDNNIPVVPRRRRQPKSKPISGSSSEESSVAPVRRFHGRSSEPSISQLSGQLFRACGSAVNSNLKRLMTHLTNNVLNNVDGKQDIHVMMIILLVLIAGLILLGYGDEKTVIHLHHWEYFNPPKDM